MNNNEPLQRVHVSLKKSLLNRLDKAVADAAAHEWGLDRTEFIRRAIVFYLDNSDEITGSRAALAYKVGDRLIDKLEILSLILLVILKVLIVRLEVSAEVVKESFDWAGKSRSGLEQRAAQIRNANKPTKTAKTRPESNH